MGENTKGFKPYLIQYSHSRYCSVIQVHVSFPSFVVGYNLICWYRAQGKRLKRLVPALQNLSSGHSLDSLLMIWWIVNYSTTVLY